MEKSENTSLSPEEWSTWTKLTERIRFVNGKIPEEAFFAWCGSFYTVPIEFMGFRVLNKKPEILLIYRKDKYYDGYHVPGAVLIPGQKMEDALLALIKRELGDNVGVDSLKFVRHFEILKGLGKGKSPRGHEIKMVFSGEIKGEPKEGEWFLMENLPQNIIPEHQLFVSEVFNRINNEIL